MLEVKAKDGKEGAEVSVLVDLGEDCEDAIARFGKEVVFSNYLANTKVGVQSGIRRYIRAGLTPDAIQEKFENYKPGVTLDRVIDPVAALANKMQKMTQEEKEEAFANLRAKLGLA